MTGADLLGQPLFFVLGAGVKSGVIRHLRALPKNRKQSLRTPEYGVLPELLLVTLRVDCVYPIHRDNFGAYMGVHTK